MKVDVTEVPPAEPTYKIELELTRRELQLLEGLTDYPAWEKQSDEISDFLEALSGELCAALGWSNVSDPKSLGFTAHVNL